MITSNIDTLILQTKLDNQKKEFEINSKFIDSLIDDKNKQNIKRDNSFTYENIKGISLEEIDEIFTNDEDKQKAKNLRLSTLFSEDKYMSKALFNTVLGKPFDIGFNYLFDTYRDKHSFFESQNSNRSLSDFLHDSVTKDYGKTKAGEKIPQEYLDEVLLEVNSFDFLSSLSSASKDQYGIYKDDKENDYSFLYNDYYLKYQELIQKYENEKIKDGFPSSYLKI